VGKKRKIVLTDRLSVAMKDAAITLTKKEEEAETALIKVPEPSPRSAIQAKLLELMGLKQTTVDALLVQHTPEAEDA
jgi:hypothetical protein